MRDRIVLITGASSGLGKITALNLATKGATVVLACRNREKGELAQYEIIHLSKNENVYLLQADLSLKSEVARLAESFKNIFPRLDVLINNAGILGLPRRLETKEGFELTIATNYFSQVLTSLFFIEWLQKSDDARIVNVSSYLHRLVSLEWKNLMLKYSYNPYTAYGQSKLMGTMFSYELAERLKPAGIAVNAVDPGTVYTNIAHSYPKVFRILYQLGEIFMDTPEKGAETIIYMASDKKAKGITGTLHKEKREQKAARWCRDKHAREKLWDETIRLLNLESYDLPRAGN